jgi:hypothetical protein
MMYFACNNYLTCSVVASDDKHFVTGAADSTIVKWKDTTAERQENERAAQTEKLLGEQRLANLIQAKEFDTALELAIKLNRPRNALKVIEGRVDFYPGFMKELSIF